MSHTPHRIYDYKNAIYSKIPRRSFSACSVKVTSYFIHYNPFGYPQKPELQIWYALPAYPHILSLVLHSSVLLIMHKCLQDERMAFSLQKLKFASRKSYFFSLYMCILLLKRITNWHFKRSHLFLNYILRKLKK